MFNVRPIPGRVQQETERQKIFRRKQSTYRGHLICFWGKASSVLFKFCFVQNRIPAKEAFVSFSKLSPVLNTYMKTFKIEFKCFRHLGKSLKDLKCGALSSANFRALISRDYRQRLFSSKNAIFRGSKSLKLCCSFVRRSTFASVITNPHPIISISFMSSNSWSPSN